jgi:predicted GIY-YIG superfamily endonuclease
MTDVASRPNSRATKNVVYLIHFDTPYKHARHYLGSTKDLTARLERHAHGNGSRLMQVITNAGITWRLARVWKCDGVWAARKLESHIKRHHKNVGRTLCPICQAERKAK